MSANVPEDLLTAACEARRHAYAPYSNFRVGAAVRSEEGRVFAGCNLENASYPLSVCAERNAIAAAVAAGARRIREVVVVTNSHRVTNPCGGCRQVIFEVAVPGCLVYAVNLGDASHTQVRTIEELLPEAFASTDLA